MDDTRVELVQQCWCIAAYMRCHKTNVGALGRCIAMQGFLSPCRNGGDHGNVGTVINVLGTRHDDAGRVPFNALGTRHAELSPPSRGTSAMSSFVPAPEAYNVKISKPTRNIGSMNESKPWDERNLRSTYRPHVFIINTHHRDQRNLIVRACARGYWVKMCKPIRNTGSTNEVKPINSISSCVRWLDCDCNSQASAIPYQPIPTHTVTYPPLPGRTIPCHAMPYHTTPVHTVLYHTMYTAIAHLAFRTNVTA